MRWWNRSYRCPIKLFDRKEKLGLASLARVNPNRLVCVDQNKKSKRWVKVVILADSRSRKTPKWMKHLQIIDSTTITLFSNLLFKGAGRHPKTGKKKGGIKVHTVIHANEGVPSDIKFTSAATNDSFMLKPSALSEGDIMAMGPSPRSSIEWGL